MSLFRKIFIIAFSFTCCKAAVAQAPTKTTTDVRIKQLSGSVYFLDCINGFGGGNVAASIGDEGILLTDDMFLNMGNKLKAALKTVSDKPIRIILNTHFHNDHIQGNMVLGQTAVIIAHENVRNRLMKKDDPEAQVMLPAVTFTDSLAVHFNGEDILMLHYPNSHTDGDAIVYFSGSKVLHLGDMFFFGMFPAVYTEGGGDIKQLIVSLEKIYQRFPPETKVIPGHGDPATMQDLNDYISMLKESVQIIETAISKGYTLERMKSEKLLAKYDALGKGGAQTTNEYIAMLYKLLKK